MPYNAEDFAGALTGPVAPIRDQAQYDQIAQGPSSSPPPVTGYPTPDHSWLAPVSPEYTGPGPTHAGIGAVGAPIATGGKVNPLPVQPTGTQASPYSFDSDPGVALAKALENQGIGSLDAWLKSAREQAIIASGDPALAGMAGFGLDPQAGVFAQQNYLSGNADLARVKRARDLAHQAIINKLAAHGIINSGELGYQEGQSNIDFGNQEYDVRQGVLAKLADFMKQYLDQKQALKQSTLGAYQQAYANYANNPDLLASLGGQIPQQVAATPSPAVAAKLPALINFLRSHR